MGVGYIPWGGQRAGGGHLSHTDISVYGSILTDPQSVRRTHPTISLVAVKLEWSGGEDVVDADVGAEVEGAGG